MLLSSEELRYYESVKKTVIIGLAILIVLLVVVALFVPCIRAYGAPLYAREGTTLIYNVKINSGSQEVNYKLVLKVIEANSTHYTVEEKAFDENGTLIGQNVNTYRIDPKYKFRERQISGYYIPLGSEEVELSMGKVLAMKYYSPFTGELVYMDLKTGVPVLVNQLSVLGNMTRTLESIEWDSVCSIG